MKKIYLLFILIYLLPGCKKTSPEILPEEENPQTEIPGSEDPDGEYTIIDGVKYDNQRVSIPEETNLVYENYLFCNRLDTMYVADSTHNLSWSVLVPESESVKAEWKIDAEIPIITSEKKFWLQNEKLWRYIFSAKIADEPVSGKGKLQIEITNETTGESLLRDLNLEVNLNKVSNDFNWVDFGMSKDEVRNLEVHRYKVVTLRDYDEWVELLPTVATLPITKFFNNGRTAYEFEDGKLVSISEFVPGKTNLYNNGPREYITEILKGLHIEGWPNYHYDSVNGSYTLLEPYSWQYNGLKITLSTTKAFHLDGELQPCTSLTFEKVE